jgi:hypothetical protein
VRKSKPFTIAFNMLTCATVFAWAKPWPRETISGLFGRKVHEPFYTGRGFSAFWLNGLLFIDWLHRNAEEFHCANTAACEQEAREVLGYHE